MANYFLTETAQFRPFSYQEMLAPVKAYQDAYNEADEKLNLLLEDAALKAFNFAPQDTTEKAIYDNMMSKLKDASDKLSSGDPTAFKTIRDINKEYRQTMLPIQQQMAKRAELAEEQRKDNMLHPNHRYSVDYRTVNLEDVHGGSTYYTYDLDAISKRAKDDTTDLVKGIIRTDFKPIPIGKTSNVLVKTGYGYDEVEFEQQMANPKSSLRQLYDAKVANLPANMPDEIKREAAKEIYNIMKANAGKFSLDTVIDYSTKPSGGNKPSGGKGDRKPVIQYGQEGDKVVAITYNGKMMTAEVEWVEENGKKVPKVKAETIKGIPNAKGETVTDREIVTITEIFDADGELLKTTQQTKTTKPTGEVTQPADSTTVSNVERKIVSRGFRR